MSAETLQDRLKQAYYYLDYLRLHRLGRKLKLFPKNRQMMDPTCADDPKKGYKSYIHRMYQTFIQHDFKYLTDVKPRNTFGYYFGINDNKIDQYGSHEYKYINMFSSPENMLAYLFRRNMLYKENSQLINAYLNAYQGNKYVRPRTMSMFYTVTFGEIKPGAYDALKEMYKIRDAHFKILESFNAEESIKNSICSVLSGIQKVSNRQKFYVYNGHGMPDTTREHTVSSVNVQTASNGFVTGVEITSNVGRNRYRREQIIPILDGISVLEEIKFSKETVDEFIQYLLGQVRTAQNLDLYQIYTFSRTMHCMFLPDNKKAIIEAIDFDQIEQRLRTEMQNQQIAEQQHRDNPEAYTVQEPEEVAPQEFRVTANGEPVEIRMDGRTMRVQMPEPAPAGDRMIRDLEAAIREALVSGRRQEAETLTRRLTRYREVLGTLND